MRCTVCGTEFSGNECPSCGLTLSNSNSEWPDPLYDSAIAVVLGAGMAATSLLQRRLKIGYARAARIMDELEEQGIIGPYEGAKPRMVLYSPEEWAAKDPDFTVRVQTVARKLELEKEQKWQAVIKKPSFQIQVLLYSILSWLLEPIPLILYCVLLAAMLFGGRAEPAWPWTVIGYTTFIFLMGRGIYEAVTRKKNIRRKLVRKSKKAAFIRKKWGVEQPQIEKNMQQTSAPVAGSISFDTMEGHQFEYFCADILRGNGFTDVEVTQGSGDYGIDVIAQKDGVTYAIQCKCYTGNIGIAAVQEANSGRDYYNAMVGVVMTNRYFTPQAKEQAQKSKILLWDRDILNSMIAQAKSTKI